MNDRIFSRLHPTDSDSPREELINGWREDSNLRQEGANRGEAPVGNSSYVSPDTQSACGPGSAGAGICFPVAQASDARAFNEWCAVERNKAGCGQLGEDHHGLYGANGVFSGRLANSPIYRGEALGQQDGCFGKSRAPYYRAVDASLGAFGMMLGAFFVVSGLGLIVFGTWIVGG